jgi:hypothetical protein
LRHRLSFIEPGAAAEGLDVASRLVPQPQVLQHLRAAGRETAEAWLRNRFAS